MATVSSRIQTPARIAPYSMDSCEGIPETPSPPRVLTWHRACRASAVGDQLIGAGARVAAPPRWDTRMFATNEVNESDPNCPGVDGNCRCQCENASGRG